MNEGRYTGVKTRFWNDEKVIAWDDDTKLLSLYLVSCPHSNILGCFVLPKQYICGDLNWTEERLVKPFKKLLEEGFMKYDDNCRLILIINYLKHNPIENGNQATAAIKQLEELPKSPILQDLKPLLKQLGKPFLEPLIERIGNPVTVTITVTGTVTGNNSPPPDGGIEGKDIAPAEKPDGGAQQRERAKTAPVRKTAPTVGKAAGKGEEYTSEFEHFWAIYPRPIEKKAAFRCWKTLLKEGVDPEDIISAAGHYAEYCRNKDPSFVKYPSTFLGRDRPYREFINGIPVSELNFNKPIPKAYQSLQDWAEGGEENEPYRD